MLSRLRTFRQIATLLALEPFNDQGVCMSETRHDWAGQTLATIFFSQERHHFEHLCTSPDDTSLILCLPQMFLEIFGMAHWNSYFFLLSSDAGGLCGQWLGKREAESYRDKWTSPAEREITLDDL